jgi:hypothetical protein
MPVAEAVVYTSGVLGFISGAVSGYRHSVQLGCGGAGIGFVLGVAGFFALYFPYVCCFTRVEIPEQGYSISGLGKYLFFPVMGVILVVAALAPWLAVGVFV